MPTAAARNVGLAEMQLSGQYDLAVAEGDDTLPVFHNPSLQTKLRALRVHNDESRYLWAFAQTEESFLRRQLCRVDALRFRRFSRHAYRRLDSLWFISQSEQRTFVAGEPAGGRKAVWLPPSIVFAEGAGGHTAQSRRVLFVASLYIALNREALRWYLKEVHGRLWGYPGYELIVAGSTNDRECARLFAEEVRRQSRCTVHLDVADLEPLYGECAVFVNPMQRGAGVKLKNIHAIERRIPVVTTTVGNEGSGFKDKEHVRVADTAEDFVAAITELWNSCADARQIAAQAYSYLQAHYNTEANVRRLLTSLTSSNARSLAA